LKNQYDGTIHLARDSLPGLPKPYGYIFHQESIVEIEHVVPAGHLSAYGALPVPHFGPELVALIKMGVVYSLCVTHYEGIPVPGPMVPYTLSPRLRHGDLKDIRPASAAAEVVTMAAHTGTHIDALCHIGEHRDAQGNPDPTGPVYLHSTNDQTVLAEQSVNYQGQTHLSIAEMPPIITRAVMLDVAGAKGVEVLPDAYMITPQDIELTLHRQETTILPGTAVLIRTGFYRHMRDGNPAYINAQSGIGVAAAQLLLQLGMNLVGSDTMAVEAIPPMDHAVHRLLLVHNGVTHLENLYLDELAAAHIYEFLMIVTPLRLQGATASWVHPIAIT
jgi:kynurenine formamidase